MDVRCSQHPQNGILQNPETQDVGTNVAVAVEHDPEPTLTLVPVGTVVTCIRRLGTDVISAKSGDGDLDGHDDLDSHRSGINSGATPPAQ